jgi:16S rRNA (uracil1498-N3)-methyltransferase
VRPSTFLDVHAGEHGETFTLHGAEARHAIAAQRIAVGEIVDIVDGSGVRLRSRVVGLRGNDQLDVIVEARTVEPPPPVLVTVVQPLIKDGELAVDHLTQVGVDQIIPWQAQHCVVHWRGDRAIKGHTKWVNAMQQAAKQSRRSRWPRIAPLASTQQIQAVVAAADLACVLEADAAMQLRDVTVPATGSVVLVVGPEGGLSPAEESAFGSATPVRLGAHVLRSSLAGAAAVLALDAHLAGSADV